MSEAKHTPGPWRVDDYYEEQEGILGADGFPVADAQLMAVLGTERACLKGHWRKYPGRAYIERTPEETQANARLIAAAPQLLKVLKSSLEQSGCDGDLCMHQWHEDARKLIDRVENADA